MPVLLIRWVGVPEDTGGLDAFLGELRDVWLAQDGLGRRISIVVDASDAGALPAALRQHQADWLAEHRQLLQRVVISVHVCIRNPIVRGALTAIRWISSDLDMLHTHPRVDGALAAALEDLQSADQEATTAVDASPSGDPHARR